MSPAAPPAADERVEMGVYEDARTARDHSLVVLAMHEDCWLEPNRSGESPTAPTGERLLVKPAAAAAVREQLDRFDHESEHWPPPPPEPLPARSDRHGWFPPLLWALALVIAFRVQQLAPAVTTRGRLDSAALWQAGAWWRPFTALWLHGDIGHLVGNLVGGSLVLRAWFATVPTARGWAALLGAATGANLIVAAATFRSGHFSLGASTLVFAGLGLLTGAAVRQRAPARHWRPLLVPFAAGLTLLGLYGAGGPRTDVLAHIAGFACGLVTTLAIVRQRANSVTSAGRSVPD